MVNSEGTWYCDLEDVCWGECGPWCSGYDDEQQLKEKAKMSVFQEELANKLLNGESLRDECIKESSKDLIRKSNDEAEKQCKDEQRRHVVLEVGMKFGHTVRVHCTNYTIEVSEDDCKITKLNYHPYFKDDKVVYVDICGIDYIRELDIEDGGEKAAQ